MKKQLSKSKLSFLNAELEYSLSNDLITSEQKRLILEQYEPKPELNFIKVVVTIGAVLVGLGVLSFIASNWDGIGKIAKLAIIFGAFITVNLTGYLLMDHYPKTGRSFLYLGVLIYGAGIFLIGQIFNFGGDFTRAFLLWSLGIIPMALQQKDKYLMLLSNILFGVYITGSFEKDFPWVGIIGIPALYFAFQYFYKSKLLLFFANLTVIDFIFLLVIQFEVKGLYSGFIFFCLGLIMYFIEHSLHREIFKLQGNVVFGVAGVVLTFPELWQAVLNTHSAQVSASVIFAVLFTGLLFALIRKGNIISLLFVCITIFRFYMDTFALLPKSLFFIIGGLLLLGFGYYFERMRKAQGGMRV